MALTNTIELQTLFPVKELPIGPDSPANTKPLTIVKGLCIDRENQDMEIIMLLAAPLDMAPGKHSLKYQSRMKKDGTGISHWYVSHSQQE
jgi:hypothetical protein